MLFSFSSDQDVAAVASKLAAHLHSHGAPTGGYLSGMGVNLWLNQKANSRNPTSVSHLNGKFTQR